MPRASSPDTRADRVAARQLGLLTRGQASQAGLTRDQILRRLASGRWLRLAPGVYRVNGAPPTWQHDVLAACLAGGLDAVASHLTAAALWGLAEPPAVPHITVPKGRSGRSGLATVHWAALAGRDVTRIGPVPVTRVERTLLDCATVLAQPVLENVVDDAIVRELAAPAAIRAAMERAARRPGRPGTRALTAALAVWDHRIWPGSPAEARLLRQISEWGLTAPERQHKVKDDGGVVVARVDLAWPVDRVGLEYDSDRWHTPRRWASDESRHAELARLGWQIRHVDNNDLRAGRGRLRAMLTELLVRTTAA